MRTTKICTKCHQEKPMDEFPWKNTVRNKRHAVCKSCTARRSRGWYENNKDAHIQNVMFHKEQARQEARKYVWEYLSSHPCCICGESDPIVLDFDHVNGKDAAVSRLVADGVSIKRIEKEIIRCQVLCCNCHRRKTAKERGWFTG